MYDRKFAREALDDFKRIMLFLFLTYLSQVGWTWVCKLFGVPELASWSVALWPVTIAWAFSHLIRRIVLPFFDMAGAISKACETPGGAATMVVVAASVMLMSVYLLVVSHVEMMLPGK